MAFIRNKKAGFDHEIIKKFEAGIQLYGFEVKSIRNNHGTLRGAHVLVRGGEAFLVNATVPPFQPKNAPDSYDPERPRKLLLNKKEIAEIEKAESSDGLTVIAISLYNKNRRVKLELAIARGRKKQDKRQLLKERDMRRSINRTLKTK